MGALSSIPSIKFHWDAYDSSSVTESGGGVTNWASVETTSLLLGGAEAQRPTYVADGGNGLPAMLFDGVNEYFAPGAGDDIASPQHIFVRFKQTDHTVDRTIFAPGTAKKIRQLRWELDDTKFYASGGIDAATFVDSDTEYQTIDTEFNGATSLIRKNGVQQGGTFDSGSDNRQNFTVGADFAGVNKFKGYIAQLVVCDVVQSAANQTIINNYLQYGPSGSLHQQTLVPGP